MSTRKFSAFASDLNSRPELMELIIRKASSYSDFNEARQTISPDGKVITFEPVAA